MGEVCFSIRLSSASKDNWRPANHAVQACKQARAWVSEHTRTYARERISRTRFPAMLYFFAVTSVTRGVERVYLIGINNSEMQLRRREKWCFMRAVTAKSKKWPQ